MNCIQHGSCQNTICFKILKRKLYVFLLFCGCELWIYKCIQGGHVVAQLVEALRYEPEGRRFDSVLLEFFIDIILPAALWPWSRLSL
jgi:hypothetical protein